MFLCFLPNKQDVYYVSLYRCKVYCCRMLQTASPVTWLPTFTSFTLQLTWPNKVRPKNSWTLQAPHEASNVKLRALHVAPDGRAQGEVRLQLASTWAGETSWTERAYIIWGSGLGSWAGARRNVTPVLEKLRGWSSSGWIKSSWREWSSLLRFSGAPLCTFLLLRWREDFSRCTLVVWQVLSGSLPKRGLRGPTTKFAAGKRPLFWKTNAPGDHGERPEGWSWRVWFWWSLMRK